MKLNKVSLREASNLLVANILNAFANKKTPLNAMITGSPGVGKSQMIFQIKEKIQSALNIEVEVVDVRLLCMEQSEVQGMPYNGDSGKFFETPNGQYVSIKEMMHSTPAWFPKDPNKYYILFFDELTNCSTGVQHAAYRILLDRTIQNMDQLPITCAIIGAGNLKSDKTGAKKLLPAAANRFAMHLEIDTNRLLEPFIEYAIEKKFSRSLVSYLQWKPTSLYDMSGDEDAFATPRTWEYVNEHHDNQYFDDIMLDIAIAGAVGSSIAIDYAGFREFESMLPNFKDIRSGKTQFTFPSDSEQAKMACVTGTIYEIFEIFELEDKEQAAFEMRNLVTLVSQMSNEMLTVLFRSMASNKSKVASIFQFPELRAEYSKVAKFLTSVRK